MKPRNLRPWNVCLCQTVSEPQNPSNREIMILQPACSRAHWGEYTGRLFGHWFTQRTQDMGSDLGRERCQSPGCPFLFHWIPPLLVSRVLPPTHPPGGLEVRKGRCCWASVGCRWWEGRWARLCVLLLSLFSFLAQREVGRRASSLHDLYPKRLPLPQLHMKR